MRRVPRTVDVTGGGGLEHRGRRRRGQFGQVRARRERIVGIGGRESREQVYCPGGHDPELLLRLDRAEFGLDPVEAPGHRIVLELHLSPAASHVVAPIRGEIRHKRALEPVEYIAPECPLRQPHRPGTEGGSLARARCGLGDAGGPERAQYGPARGLRDRTATPLDPRPPEEIPELGGRESERVDDSQGHGGDPPEVREVLEFCVGVGHRGRRVRTGARRVREASG